MNSQSQKEANVRYMRKIKGKYKKLNVSMLAEEYNEFELLLEQNGLSKIKFIRVAVKRLKDNTL